jgi:2,4-dienoyl-CoA reductase-like NADH-dependent reductase (Old Yellow Enzyme family)
MEKSKFLEKYTLNNKVEVPNRLCVAPLTLFASNPDGTINDDEREYLKFRGTGIGLYILGATAVNQEGLTFLCQPRALSEKDLSSLEERAKIIKSQGALAINQIHHGGIKANPEFSGTAPLAPSSEIADKLLKEQGSFSKPTKEMTSEDIKKVIEGFAKATELSIKSGYDGIEIHGANNFILQQFYSPYTNRRNDEWGGSDEKRMKFPLEVVDACCKIREKLNRPDFIIGYRLSPEEPYDTGLTMTETIKLVKALVNKPLQFIHISQWNYFKKAHRGEGAGEERLKTIHNLTKGKTALIGVGGLLSEDDLNKAFNTGFSEFIGVGCASMINKDFGILLKENKGSQLNLELDPDHPEKYSIPPALWKMCTEAQDWLPPVKGKPHKKLDL